MPYRLGKERQGKLREDGTKAQDRPTQDRLAALRILVLKAFGDRLQQDTRLESQAFLLDCDFLTCLAHLKGKSCCQILSKKSSLQTKSKIKASVSRKEPRRGLAKVCRQGGKLGLRLFKKSQREPAVLMLVIPALGRLRQDDRTFVPVGLIPSKYHKKKKKRGQKTQCLAGRQRNPLGMMTVKEVPPTGLLDCKGPHRPDSRLLPGNLPGPS